MMLYQPRGFPLSESGGSDVTQFIELELSDGQIMRFNVAAISRYFRPEGQPTSGVFLMYGDVLDVKQDVAEIDTRIRNADGRAIISEA